MKTVIKKIDNKLCSACVKGDLEEVKNLIDKGANINVADNSPLRWCAWYGHVEIMQYLIEKGADVHADNDSAFIWSCSRGYLNTVKFLVEKGVNLRMNNDEGLINSIKSSHFDIAQWLVDNGADISVAKQYDDEKVKHWLKYMEMRELDKSLTIKLNSGNNKTKI